MLAVFKHMLRKCKFASYFGKLIMPEVGLATNKFGKLLMPINASFHNIKIDESQNDTKIIKISHYWYLGLLHF